MTRPIIAFRRLFFMPLCVNMNTVLGHYSKYYLSFIQSRLCRFRAEAVLFSGFQAQCTVYSQVQLAHCTICTVLKFCTGKIKNMAVCHFEINKTKCQQQSGIHCVSEKVYYPTPIIIVVVRFQQLMLNS